MDSVHSTSSRTEVETRRAAVGPRYDYYFSEQSNGKSGTDDIGPIENMAESTSSDLSSTENAANAARLRWYRTKFTAQLLRLITDSELEYGFSSSLDVFLRERLAENALATKEWLNELFIEYYPDVSVATGTLRAIAHLDYHEIAPQGPTIALAALSHSNLEVRECGVRSFENWATLECLSILRSVQCNEEWMQDYVTQAIADLEEAFGADVTACKED